MATRVAKMNSHRKREVYENKIRIALVRPHVVPRVFRSTFEAETFAWKREEVGRQMRLRRADPDGTARGAQGHRLGDGLGFVVVAGINHDDVAGVSGIYPLRHGGKRGSGGGAGAPNKPEIGDEASEAGRGVLTSGVSYDSPDILLAVRQPKGLGMIAHQIAVGDAEEGKFIGCKLSHDTRISVGGDVVGIVAIDVW